MGTYLPSGVTYPSYLDAYGVGITAGGQDYVPLFINSASGLTTVPGYSQTLSTSRTFISYSGTSSPVLLIAPSGATPLTGDVFDAFGGAAGKNIIISGTNSSVLINGGATASISTAYGKKSFYFVSGNSWIVA